MQSVGFPIQACGFITKRVLFRPSPQKVHSAFGSQIPSLNDDDVLAVARHTNAMPCHDAADHQRCQTRVTV